MGFLVVAMWVSCMELCLVANSRLNTVCACYIMFGSLLCVRDWNSEDRQSWDAVLWNDKRKPKWLALMKFFCIFYYIWLWLHFFQVWLYLLFYFQRLFFKISITQLSTSTFSVAHTYTDIASSQMCIRHQTLIKDKLFEPWTFHQQRWQNGS